MPRPLMILATIILAAGRFPSDSPGQTPSPNQEAVMATLNQFVDGFNQGDTERALAACADETSIIDEFPPYEWGGAGACASWMDDYVANAEENAITEGVVTLGTPKHVDVAGEHAYAVIPSDYAFKQNGDPQQETGSMFTFALEKETSGWRITGWSWSKN